MRIGNIGALQIFQGLRQISTLAIAVFLAKSGLELEVIGGYEKLLFIGFVISFFWTTGIIQGLLSIFPEKPPAERPEWLWSIYFFFCGVSLALFFLLSSFESFFLKILTGQGYLDHFQLFLAYFCINLPSQLLEYYYLLYQRHELILRYGIISHVLQVCIMIIPLFAGFSIQISFWGVLVLAVFKHVALWFFVLNKGNVQFQQRVIQSLLKISLPFMVYSFMGGLNQFLDNWLVGFWYKGDDQVFAIFRYGARELPLAIGMANAFSIAMIPVVAKDYKKALLELKKKSAWLMHVLFPVAIAGMLFSSILFKYAFQIQFVESATIFNVYLLILISRLTFPHTVLTGLRDGKAMMAISITEFVVNVLFSVLLVRYYGIWGIAMGSVVSYSMEKVMGSLWLSFKHGIRFSEYTPLGWFILYSSMLVLAFLFKIYV